MDDTTVTARLTTSEGPEGMNLHLNIPRPSTILLCGLLLALLVSSPVPLAVTVAVTVWALHTPAALVAGIALVLAWRVTHPKAAR